MNSISMASGLISQRFCARQLLLVFTVGLLTLFCISVSHAQVQWQNNTGSPDPWYHNGTTNWVGNLSPRSTQTALFDPGGSYSVWWNGITQSFNPEVGQIIVANGNDVTFESQDPSTQWEMIINGSGAGGATSDFSVAGTLTNRGIHLRSLGGAEILDGGNLTLDGTHAAGSRLTVEGSSGFDVYGTFNVVSGGIASVNNDIVIARTAGSTGSVSVSGAGSQLSTDRIYLGLSGTGDMTVGSGGLLTSSSGNVGSGFGSGSVIVTGENARWNNSGELVIGSFGTGDLRIESTGAVSSSSVKLGEFSFGSGVLSVADTGSQLSLTSDLYVGHLGSGLLNIGAGGLVTGGSGTIGNLAGSDGIVTVTGANARWNNTSLDVGRSGNGRLTLDFGGDVNCSFGGTIARETDSIGIVTVREGASWSTGNALVIGRKGAATLDIQSGGLVTSTDAYAGDFTGTANITVTGSDSHWEVTRNLYLGGESFRPGTAMLNILDNGRVSVGGISTIEDTATVNLNGGRFEFGQTSMAEFESINRVSGSMAGDVTVSGFRSVGSLTSLQNSPVNLDDVRLMNQGILYGDGNLNTGLNNQAGGEVEVVTGERMRFAGNGNLNAGEINNFGSTIRFDQDVTNQTGGFVSGRGQFIANAGWTNEGVMAFSAGPADILGDVDNRASGRIVTSGGTTTTFFDDVVNNGEIRTSAGSASVFFGSASGAGNYTGTGSVFFEGDLRPGNSPGIVAFEGDLILGSLASMQMELAGREPGEFDRLEIAGNLFLDGFLSVDLLNNFQLDWNDEFLIADVGGTLSGQFTGLGEGDRVGNFGGMDLFISYTAGNGNDVALFTSVPEPNVFMVCTLGIAIGFLQIRRRRPDHFGLEKGVRYQ